MADRPTGPALPEPGVRHRHRRQRPRRRVVGAAVAGVVLTGAVITAAVAVNASSPGGDGAGSEAAASTRALGDASQAPSAGADGADVPLLGGPAEPVAFVSAGATTAVVGDSLALGLYPVLADLLPDRRIEYTAEVGTSTSWMLARLSDLSRRNRLPDVVAISAGTNDFGQGVEGYAALARRAMTTAGPDRCVVWSTISRPQRLDDESEINEALALVDAEFPNLLVVDWAGLVDDDQRLLGSDGVHPTGRGLDVRAKAYADAVLTCSPLDPDAPRPDNPVPSTWGQDGSSGSSTGGSGATSRSPSSAASPATGADDDAPEPVSPAPEPPVAEPTLPTQSTPAAAEPSAVDSPPAEPVPSPSPGG